MHAIIKREAPRHDFLNIMYILRISEHDLDTFKGHYTILYRPSTVGMELVVIQIQSSP